MYNKVAIGLGSNLGDSLAILEGAFESLQNTPKVQVVGGSSWYKTAPMGGPKQPDYLNACAVLNVEMTPEHLLATLMSIEQSFDRVREVRWGPRTLDLDILLYENKIIDMPHLQIPHPRILERAFVLVPLAEIASDWTEPVSGKTIGQLAKKLDTSKIIRY